MRAIVIFLFVLSSELHAGGIKEADTYKQHSGLQWEWAIDAIEHFTWKGDERVLDVGCGDGKITKVLLDKTPFGIVLGLDLSDAMIRLASTTFHHPRLFFLQGDALNLPFYRQFDVATAFCSLHWVMDQATALSKIHQCLIPGGYALIATPGFHPNNISRRCENLVQEPKWAPFFDGFQPQRVYFTYEEYKALLHDAGFEIIHSSSEVHETIYPDKGALMKWLKPLVTFIGHLTPGLQEEFLSDLVDAMIAYETEADANIPIHHLKLHFVARKPS